MLLVDIEEQTLRSRGQESVRWGRRLVYRRLRVGGWADPSQASAKDLAKVSAPALPARCARGRAIGPRTGHKRCGELKTRTLCGRLTCQFDQNRNGRRLKFPNMIEDYSRICLTTCVGKSFNAEDVIAPIEVLRGW